MNQYTEPQQAAIDFLNKIEQHQLEIVKVDQEVVTPTTDWLLNRIFENGEVDIVFNIEDSHHVVKVSIDEDTAIVVYDYHEVFDEIAEDIRQMNGIMQVH